MSEQHIAPVDLVVIGRENDPDLWTDPSMFNEVTHLPGWTRAQVPIVFFGKPREWLRDHIRRGHIGDIHGVSAPTPGKWNDQRNIWRLCDVEQAAHDLARGGYISLPQLLRTVDTVKVIAQTWGYLPTPAIEYRIERHDPERKGVFIVERQTEFTDDLDGSIGAVPRFYAVGTVNYVINLTDEHWEQLLDVLRPWMAKSQKLGNRSLNRAVMESTTKDGVIRSWAREQGYPLGGNGPIPVYIAEAYDRAHRLAINQ
jgi:hypothetical protein